MPVNLDINEFEYQLPTEKIAKYPLSKNARYELEGSHLGKNTLIIEDGKAYCILMERVLQNNVFLLCLSYLQQTTS